MKSGCKLIKWALLFSAFFQCAAAATTPVYNRLQLVDKINSALPGDTILVQAGVYPDVQLNILVKGTAAKPIVIMPQEPASVAFTGNSFIKIGGEYVAINGFIFQNGASKERAVIEFRTKETVAQHCRITHCKIENYSKPIRFDTDSWIIFWGKNNRVDNCYIGDKLNAGTTIIVELNDERSQQNHHLIDSNFFAGRSRLGSNGGETIRIGVSRYSLTSSQTTIKDNLFYHCSGEVEIISVKSCNNQIVNNTFFECEGNVVLRHGQSTTIANNIFIGNGKPFTGGVRVIDSGHIITNNLMIGLAGNRFRSALAVMNAVPNSLPNRYLHVKNITIHRNLFLDCSNIIFGSGKDVERTLAPSNVAFTNNTIVGKKELLLVDNNNDGQIKCSNNTTGFSNISKPGFSKIATQIPESNFNIGEGFAPLMQFLQAHFAQQINVTALHFLNNLPAIQLSDSTATPPLNLSFAPSNVKELTKFLSASATQKNATILLATGQYALTKELVINQHITIKTSGTVSFVNGTEKSFQAFILLEEGGNLNVDGVVFNANFKDAGDVQAGIATPKDGLLHHYTLSVSNCQFNNFNEGGYSAIKATKSSYADAVTVANCLFQNNAGVCLDFGAEKDDKGIYNVENLEVNNCVFTNNLGPAINVYRGGNDESTTGPFVTINHCVFNETDNREQSYVVRLIGAQYARVTNCIFNNSGAGGRSIWFEEYSWDDVKVDHCNFYNAGRVQTFYGKLFSKNNLKIPPKFKPDFTIFPNPLLTGKATDGGNIGLK